MSKKGIDWAAQEDVRNKTIQALLKLNELKEAKRNNVQREKWASTSQSQTENQLVKELGENQQSIPRPTIELKGKKPMLEETLGKRGAHFGAF